MVPRIAEMARVSEPFRSSLHAEKRDGMAHACGFHIYYAGETGAEMDRRRLLDPEWKLAVEFGGGRFYGAL